MSPVELPVGAFLNKSLPAAIRLYLSAIKKKQTTAEIAAALKEGGVESTSENFDRVVKSSLGGLKAKGDVLRFKDGWAQAELFNPSMRKRLADGQKAAPKRAVKKKAKVKTKPKAAAAPAPPSTPPASEPAVAGAHRSRGIREAVEAHFAQAGQELSTKDVADALNLTVQTAGLMCAQLVKAGNLEKTPAGSFRMAHLAVLPKTAIFQRC